MTTRNLDYFFKTRSVAVIGASRNPAQVGGVVARNLQAGGYDGTVMRVNHRAELDEAKGIYRDISQLPSAPELAIIAVPAARVPAIIADLGAAGTRAAVILSAGFEESRDHDGDRLQQAVLDAARPHLLRIIGPNCLGIMVPKIGLNATFAHLMPKAGKLAFIAQSGAVLTAVADWAAAREIGFASMISLGASADVDFGDLLDYLANDWEINGILLYVESIHHARKFMSAARLAARLKPVIVVKGGRYEESAGAVASHTGALAGASEVYSAAFRRAGMVEVDTLSELFDAVETLAHTRHRFGERLAILSNGGGIGVLATDELARLGGVAAPLSEETRHKLSEALPALCAITNPVDILGDADPQRYRRALDILYAAKEVDTVAVFNCPVGVASSSAAAQAVIDTPNPYRKGLLTNWLGSETARYARKLFADNSIPTYETPDQVIQAFMHLVQYRRNQQNLLETPPSMPGAFTPDTQAAATLTHEVLSQGRSRLNQEQGMALLAAYGVPGIDTRTAESPQAAAQIAEAIGKPVALKIISPDIVHKRAVGGVALNLQTPAAVREAAEAMRERLGETLPDARLEGFSVQPMAPLGDAHELIIGLSTDPLFGPVLLFGHGGNAVEALADTALALPPLSMHLARDLMRHTRVYRILQGVGGLPAANLDEIAATLVKLSQLAADLPEVAELEVNPLVADASGVRALDVRARLETVASGQCDARFAIRPYPKELEESFVLPDGEAMILRPIQPEDEPALIELFDAMTEQERYMRFFSPMPQVPHQMAARLSQIDYDREMALVLAERDKLPGKAKLVGGARIAGDPNNERCEFAIGVRHAYTGMGLGVMLLRKIVDYARRRGYREVYGDILRENQPMLGVCRKLGFQIRPGNESGAVRAVLRLDQNK